jgi:hypothetical protein
VFSNDLTLDKVDGTDVVFRLLASEKTGETRRVDIASTPAEPKIMFIRHSSSGKGATAVDRHNVTFSETVDASPSPVVVSVSLSVTVPRNPAVTQTQVYDLLNHISDFIAAGAVTGLASTANLEALLRGEG